MTTPAREQQLEQWLRRQQPPPGASAPTDACVDAETAAAWVDGALPPSVVSPMQAHVAGCARCQTLLRTLVDLPAEPFETGAAPPVHAWWRSWLAWAAPLGAAAVAVLALAVWLRVPAPVEQATERRESSIERARQGAGAQPNEVLGAVAAAPGSAMPAPSGNSTQTAPPSAPAASEAPPQRARLAEATSAPEERSAAKAAVAAPAAAADAMNRVASTDAERAAPPPAPAPPPPAAARAAAPASAALGLAADTSRSFTLTAPTGDARWRVSGSRVERSADGGQTWTNAALPGTVTLAAGSAVSPTTCWLVGASGAVLVTTDGTTWHRVAFVESVDLTGVLASSAVSATVEAADGRRFLTRDSGQTWERQ